MKRAVATIVLLTAAVSGAVILPSEGIGLPKSRADAANEAGDVQRPAAQPSTTVVEARGRARLLHEAIHGALQVVHRDFFLEDESAIIPSQSLEDVFVELARSHKVTLKWLVVEGNAMNVDHKPADDFERKAADALANGHREFDAAEGDSYRYAGAIRLSSQCLKCHVPNRTNTKDRTAGLVISMSLKRPE